MEGKLTLMTCDEIFNVILFSFSFGLSRIGGKVR